MSFLGIILSNLLT